MRATTFGFGEILPESAREFALRRLQEFVGLAVMALTVALGVALATWSISDPSLNHATNAAVHNLLGAKGAIVADLVMQMLGVSAIVLLAPLGMFGWRVFSHRGVGGIARFLVYWFVGVFSAAAVASLLPMTDRWPLPTGLGGVIGDALVVLPKRYFSPFGLALSGVTYLAIAILSLAASLGPGAPDQENDEKIDATDSGAQRDSSKAPPNVHSTIARDSTPFPKFFSTLSLLQSIFRLPHRGAKPNHEIAGRQFNELRSTFEYPPKTIAEAHTGATGEGSSYTVENQGKRFEPVGHGKKRLQIGPSDSSAIGGSVALTSYAPPSTNLLAPGKKLTGAVTQDSLEQNARLLEGVLEDFSVKGDIVSVYPGPVVTLYEFEPAPGIKSSRVIGLSDDIARSMSAVSARVAVV
ncbi:DNA translocase FtsK 4TM domain-containing protein, partial [Rhodoblastus acidophilus]